MSAQKKKILIVEDHETVLEIFKEMLSEEYELIIEASDGKQAIKTYTEQKPDLVIMDIIMPNMHGIDAIKQIRELDPASKIIIVTAHDGPQLREDAAQYKIRHYIKKPFHKNVLTEAIEKTLNNN